MASFLDDLSIYNAKAVVVIANAVADGQYNRANMMSGLKNTANDTTLTDAIRLNALTALINQGKLLDIPLAPYFPVAVTFADSQTYDGVHNDLLGLQGGTAGEYFHLTQSQLNKVGNAAVLGDITFQNLGGTYSDNAGLANIINSKQAQLSGTGFVKASGTTITYDNTTYLTTISGIAAGGQLTGTYPNPSLSNAAVIGKVLTGWNGSATPAAIAAGDSILIALQKLNANLNQVISSPTGVTSVGLTNNAASVFTTTTGPLTGAATLNIGLNTQNANRVLASGTSINGQQPTFRSLVVADLPSSGATPGNYGGAALIPQITVDAKGRITAISTVAAAGGGQVNSVGLSIPGIFGAVTNTGTAADPVLTFGLSTQSATYVWAGPVSGAATVPSFRALASTDIPNIGITQVTGLSGVLDGFLRDSLSDGSMWVGNTSNAPIQRVLSGDVTISNLGVTAIGLAKVQYNMIQDVTTQTLLGRYDAVDGEVQQVTLSGDFLLDTSSGILSLSSPVSPVVTTKGDLLGHDLTAQQRVPSNNIDGSILLVNNSATGTYTDLGLNWVAMSGDATIAASGAITIANSAVTLGKMANLAANSFIGNNTGSAATPIALTATQATAMLNQFTSSLKGLVPAASGGLDATYFLNATGGWSVPAGGGGGGSGTVTSVSVVSANGFAGTVATPTVAAAITLTTTVTGLLKGNGTAISAATAGTDYLTSVGLTMPSAFTVTTSPLTANGTLAVTGAGTTSQYVRGDGTLGIFPSIGGGGGGTVYYLNGGVTASPSTIGGVAMYQLSKAPVTAGASVDFSANTNGAVIASFLTDTGDPNQTSIPAGIWIFECYLSAAGGGSAHPTVQAVVETWDGTTLSVIATGVAEEITNGTTKDLYQFAVTIPTGTTISTTDRIVVQIKIVAASSKTVTLYTQDNNVSSVTTTFANGISSLNGLTAATQFFGAVGTTGTAPAWTSTTATHTLNIPLASASSVTAGLISKTDYDSFAGKLANVLTTTGDIIYSSSGTTAARLGIGTANQVLAVSAGLIPEWKTIAAGGDVTGPSSSVDGNFAVFNSTTGKIIMESAGASLSAAGAAVFNTSVSIGVSSTTTGQLVFRNSANAFTTTIQASASASANANYTLPQAPGTVGQILSTDGSGNLSWTAAGAGNVTTGGTQTFTGTNTFNANSLRINNATNTFYTLLASNVALANKTVTFPDLTGTVALTNATQTISGQNTYTTAIQSFNTTLSVNKWSAAGAGIFRIESASENTYTILETVAGTSNKTVTFPNSSGTVALTNSASTQVFTTAQTFQNTVFINRFGQSGNLRIESASENTYTQFETVAGTSNKTVIFPNATGTVPLLSLAQTFSALQTFSAGLTVSAGTTTISGAATITGGATFTTTVSTFYNSILRIGNTSNTFFYTIAGSAISAARQLNLPLITTTDTFAVLGLAQTFTAAQKFSGALSVIEANASMGLATLAAGTVTVSTARVTATSRIYLTVQTAGGTQGLLRISARVAGTSFTITSLSATETSTVAWLIIEPT